MNRLKIATLLATALLASSASAESCVRGVQGWTAEEAIALEQERIEREGYHPNCSQTAGEAKRYASSSVISSHEGDGDHLELWSLPWGVSALERTMGGRKFLFLTGAGEGVAKVRFPTPLLQYQPTCGTGGRPFVPAGDRPTWTCYKHVQGSEEWTESRMQRWMKLATGELGTGTALTW